VDRTTNCRAIDVSGSSRVIEIRNASVSRVLVSPCSCRRDIHIRTYIHTSESLNQHYAIFTDTSYQLPPRTLQCRSKRHWRCLWMARLTFLTGSTLLRQVCINCRIWRPPTRRLAVLQAIGTSFQSIIPHELYTASGKQHPSAQCRKPKTPSPANHSVYRPLSITP